MPDFNKMWPFVAQLIRYGVVGLLNNMVGYPIYLLVTWLLLDPKTTVTVFYPIAALIGYFAHARYAFYYRGEPATACCDL